MSELAMLIAIAIKRSNLQTLILTGCCCLLAIGLAVGLNAIASMNARITEMNKQIGFRRKQIALSLAENTKMNARITEMSKQIGFRRK